MGRTFNLAKSSRSSNQGTVMKYLVVASALSIATPAGAADVSISITDAEQANFAQLSGAFDQCVAKAILHSDGSVCKNILDFITLLAPKVAAGRAPPPPQWPEPPVPGAQSTPPVPPAQ